MPFTGSEPGTPVGFPGTHFFDFNAGIVRQLLARPDAVGIRFHFDQARPNFPTELYAAACGPKNDIMDPANNGADFFRSTGQAIAFDNLPPVAAANFESGAKAGSCVFVSRAVLEGDILGTELNPTGANTVRLFVENFGLPDTLGTPTFTLVAIGLDSGIMTGSFLKSEQPCPPNCPDDDPYGRRVFG